MNESIHSEMAQKAFNDHYAFLAAGDLDQLIRVWDENGVYEFPFPPPGFPTKLEGRSAIRDFLKGIVANVKFDRWLDQQFYSTHDPDTLIVEFRSQGQTNNTERPYNQAYISIICVREGKIVLLKEYFNPLIVVEAFATAPKSQS